MSVISNVSIWLSFMVFFSYFYVSIVLFSGPKPKQQIVAVDSEFRLSVGSLFAIVSVTVTGQLELERHDGMRRRLIIIVLEIQLAWRCDWLTVWPFVKRSTSSGGMWDGLYSFSQPNRKLTSLGTSFNSYGILRASLHLAIFKIQFIRPSFFNYTASCKLIALLNLANIELHFIGQTSSFTLSGTILESLHKQILRFERKFIGSILNYALFLNR